jgi:small GTP-binding protein
MVLHRVFLYGIDQAGKTALLLSMKNRSTFDNTNPTLAFNISKMTVKEIEFQIWDAPGQQKFRNVWKQGFERAEILVFVLDTADTMRYPEAYEEFTKVIEDPITRGVPLVFCYHKMDLPEAQAALPEAKKMFKLSTIRSRKLLAYQTTIMNVQTLVKLEDTLVNIIMGLML